MMSSKRDVRSTLEALSSRSGVSVYYSHDRECIGKRVCERDREFFRKVILQIAAERMSVPVEAGSLWIALRIDLSGFQWS
jgi:hypothetical protein